MKILKMLLFSIVVAVPVGLGAFQYGKNVNSKAPDAAAHTVGGQDGNHREKHLASGADHAVDHESHAHEDAFPHKEKSTESHVALSDRQIRTLGLVFARAGPGDIETFITLPGEIVMNDDTQALVTPYVSGHVKEIGKRQGDRVRKGEVMAVLESRELADAASAYLAAREHLIIARKHFDREKKLWQQRISPETDYLEARMALSAAEIQLRSARQKLMALGLGQTDIERFPRQANASLTRYEILSPVDGEVLWKHLTLGEMVESTRAVYRVADMKTVWVEISLLQRQLPCLKKGMAVSVHTENPLQEARGTLTYVGPLVGKETRTASGRAVLHNPEGRWRPGLFVTVKIAAQKRQMPVVVPRQAVQRIEGQPVVFVPVENGFEAKGVTTGEFDEINLEITSGLSEGETYVSEGAFELKAALVTDTLDGHAGHGH